MTPRAKLARAAALAEAERDEARARAERLAALLLELGQRCTAQAAEIDRLRKIEARWLAVCAAMREAA